MTSMEISCRHTGPDGVNCAAQAGELCHADGSGRTLTQPEPHPERIEDAAAMTGGGNVTHEEFDRAMTDGSFPALEELL